MIELNLKRYVDNAHISINKLSKATGISRPTLTNMYNGKSSGIQFETLETLCSFFNIGIPDLLEMKISSDRFAYLELSGMQLNTELHRIVGIQFERIVNEIKEFEVAAFIISYDKDASDDFNNQRSNSSKKLNGSLNYNNAEGLSEKGQKELSKIEQRLQQANNPKRLYFSVEWIIPQEIDSLKNNINAKLLKQLQEENMMMTYGETVSLYRSLPVETLAEINYHLLANFIDNSSITVDKDTHYIVSSDWNLGTESSMNPNKYHFELALQNNFFVSLDSENDGISQQLEFEHTKLSPAIKKTLYPNLSDLS